MPQFTLDNDTWVKIEGWIAEAGGKLNDDSDFREDLLRWSYVLRSDRKALQAKGRRQASDVADGLRALQEALQRASDLNLLTFMLAYGDAGDQDWLADFSFGRFQREISRLLRNLEIWLAHSAPKASRPKDLNTAFWVEDIAFNLEAKSGIPLRDGRGRTSDVAITLLCQLWSETVSLNHGRGDNRRAIQKHLKRALDERDRERSPGAKKHEAAE